MAGRSIIYVEIVMVFTSTCHECYIITPENPVIEAHNSEPGINRGVCVVHAPPGITVIASEGKTSRKKRTDRIYDRGGTICPGHLPGGRRDDSITRLGVARTKGICTHREGVTEK